MSRILQKALSVTLIEMARVDQLARRSVTASSASRLLVYAIDAAHHLRMRLLVDTNGFPTHATIGTRAMRAWWLLVQHMDSDPQFQRACLEQCDFAPKEHALLTDRVLVNEGDRQLFGTQFYRTKKGLQLRPISLRRSVDERRKKVGLPPLAEAITSMRDREQALAKKSGRKVKPAQAPKKRRRAP